MARAARMDMNRCAPLGETPRRSRVIEMNVTEKNVANIVGGETRAAHRYGNVFESRRRSRVEKGDAVAGLERGCRNDSGTAKMFGVEDMDHESDELK